MRSSTLAVALLGATFFIATPASAELSAFDAGKVDAKNPYGLTKNEKVLLENKEKLKTLDTKYIELNSTQQDLRQSLDGVKSVVEGVNSQYSKLNTQMPKLKSELEQMDENLSSEINHLRDYIKESRKIQESNYAQIKLILDELSKLVDKINSNYVSRQNLLEQLKENNKNSLRAVADAGGSIVPVVVPAKVDENSSVVKDINKSKKEAKPELKKEVEKKLEPAVIPVKKDDSWKKKNKKQILQLAIKETKDKKYDEASDKFKFLITKKYSRATSNFYLGEISYLLKDYAGAIDYYKKSSAVSTKTWFMPKLLYHTAISLDKLGDTKSANQFYKALKQSYPKSREAKASPNRK